MIIILIKMINNSDFEKFWFLYKKDNEPKNESVNVVSSLFLILYIGLSVFSCFGIYKDRVGVPAMRMKS